MAGRRRRAAKHVLHGLDMQVPRQLPDHVNLGRIVALCRVSCCGCLAAWGVAGLDDAASMIKWLPLRAGRQQQPRPAPGQQHTDDHLILGRTDTADRTPLATGCD
jgi:hypothetical protein